MSLRGILTLFLCLQISHATASRTLLYPTSIPLFIHALDGDSNGLLWLATSTGVFRFDGSNYHQIPGYPFASAERIAVDPAGIVWAGGAHGLAKYQNAAWSIVMKDRVESLAISKAGLWVSAKGLARYTDQASATGYPAAKPTGELQTDRDDALWFPCGDRVCTMRGPAWEIEWRPSKAPGVWGKVIPEKGWQRYWLSSTHEIALVEGGVEASRQRANFFATSDSTLDPVLAPDGRIWGTRFSLRDNSPLRLWQTITVGTVASYFSSASTRWLSAESYVAKSMHVDGWDVWSGNVFSALSPKGFVMRKQERPIAFTTRGIIELNPSTSAWEYKAAAGKTSISNMIEDGTGGYWAATLDEGLVRLGRDFRLQEQFNELCDSPGTFRALLRDGKGRIWAGGKDPNCFFEIQGSRGHWKFIPQRLPGTTMHTVDMHADANGTPWVGYEGGIAYFEDNGTWTKIPTSRPVEHIRTFAFDGRNIIWVSHRRNGAFTKLERKGNTWEVTSFPASQYAPQDTQFLHVDSRGWLWRGTLVDLQVARPGHMEPAEWLHLSHAKGLATDGTNLLGWAEDSRGQIWHAGANGVSSLKPAEEWFQAPHGKQPLVTRLRAGGQTWLDADHMPAVLPDDGGQVEIDLSTMQGNAFLKAPLRYRIGSEWKQSLDGRLLFGTLAAGHYELEAAFNGDGAAQSMRFPFQVGERGWRNRLALAALALLALLGVIVWRYREWFQYWSSKRAYLMRRRLAPGRAPHAGEWTDYSGKTLVNRFRIEKRILRSLNATTYFGTDIRTSQRVAVKVIHRLSGLEREMRIRFANEVAALHTLGRGTEVRLLDSWISDEGEPCLAMPFIEGPTLREYMDRNESLETPVLAGILEHLGARVSEIHKRGIVHRDLKPENIMLVDQGGCVGRLEVIDFGSAAAKGPQDELEMTTTVTGSMHYLAPERISGQYSIASDVYSLGVIALELLTGKRPAEHDVATASAEFEPLMSQLVGGATAALIAAALRHQPGQRPQDAGRWAAELACALREVSASRQAVPPSI